MLAVHKNKKSSDGYRLEGKTYFFRDGLCEVPEDIHSKLVSMGVVEKEIRESKTKSKKDSD